MSDLDERIEALRREGRYGEAARLCIEHGDPQRGSELLAAVWDFAGAVEVAERAGLLELAYKHALSGEDPHAAARLLAMLTEHPDRAPRAAQYAEAKGRLADAARLVEAAADLDGAAALYERAGELFDAARCRESQGQYREAGLLYERRVREAPDDGESALRLGRILAHFGRWDHAVRALQVAAGDPERRTGALELMVACFAALGLPDAAASRLDELRRDDPSLPIAVPEFLEEQFGDERGIAGLVRDGEADGGRLLAGRYRILRPLGAGATGRVLLAHDGFHDRDVAVKVLTVGSGSAGRDAYVRFAREARVAAGLDHPNVVRVFEFNPHGPFLVMEYMPGGTLEDRLEGGGRGVRLPVAKHVLVSVLNGLVAVHRRGVVHRDIKPANIFFGAAGDVKIGDFGVAHLADLGATLTGAMLGTLAYMAPEQVTGARRPDASTDLYALGVILFRILTGELPFAGPDFVTQHLSAPVPLPSDRAPALGTAYDALVAALLAKEAPARPRTAADARAMVETLPWLEPDERAVEVATGLETRLAEPEAQRVSSVPPPADVRYAPVEPLADGGYLARDHLLGRVVRMEPCDEPRARWLRGLALADNPWLQAVYLADPEQGTAILEHPTGRLLADLDPGPERRARIVSDVRRALARMHEAGIAHGAVRADMVRVADGRAVLLVPLHPPPHATPEADLTALDTLDRGHPR